MKPDLGPMRHDVDSRRERRVVSAHWWQAEPLWACLLALLLPAAACSDEAGRPLESSDMGTDLSPDVPVAGASCPAGVGDAGLCLPEAPRFSDWVCPDGWAPFPALTGAAGEDLAEGLAAPFTACAPPAPAADCPAGTMARAGTAECVAIGSDCPAAGERWPEEPALRARAADYTGRVHYVDSGVTPGEGSRAQPFASIANALVAASAGDIVALSRGTHRAELTLARNIALLGACPAETIVTGEGANPAVTLSTAGLVSDLTLEGERPGIAVTPLAGAATIRSVVIRGALDTSVLVDARSGTLFLEGLLIETALADGPDRVAAGLEVFSGTVEANGLTVRAVEGFGVSIVGGTTILRETLIVDTQPLQGSRFAGMGIIIGGGVLSLERSLVQRNGLSGVLVYGPSRMALLDVEIAQTGPDLDGYSGYGLTVEAADTGAPAVTVRQALVRGNLGHGVSVVGPGATLEATDILILDTGLDQVIGDGAAVSVLFGALATLERALLLRNHGAAGVVQELDSGLRLRDVLIADTQPGEWEGRGGTGASAGFGGYLSVERGLVLRNHDTGILVLRSGTRAALSDIQIRDTAPRPDGLYGRALEVSGGAWAVVTRCVLDGAQDVGLLVATRGSAVSASHLSVRAVAPRGDGLSGIGITMYGDADVTLSHFTIREAALAGLQVANDGRQEFADGLVSDNPIGLNVQSEDFELSTIERVRVVNNDIDVDYRLLPIPSAAALEDLIPDR